jgi:hypothetical protein
MRVAVGIFLILHGLVHLGIWGPSSAPDAPWDTSRSWLLRGADKGTRRTVAIVLATITTIGYVLAGVALLAGGQWWSPAAIMASVVSLVLLFGYFHPWLSFGFLLDAAIIWAAVASWPE